MLRILCDWLSSRRARKETERRMRELQVRARIFGKMKTTEGYSPTKEFENVKKEVDKVVDIKKKARSAAKRITDMGEDK
jgi:hypothetical protein